MSEMIAAPRLAGSTAREVIPKLSNCAGRLGRTDPRLAGNSEMKRLAVSTTPARRAIARVYQGSSCFAYQQHQARRGNSERRKTTKAGYACSHQCPARRGKARAQPRTTAPLAGNSERTNSWMTARPGRHPTDTRLAGEKRD
jgi:hypothetical protein